MASTPTDITTTDTGRGWPDPVLAVTCPESHRARLPERVEQKFFIPPARIPQALGLLRRTCRTDPEHPGGQVNSLYFDTPDFDQHERSLSGDFAKDKIRIRWYGEESDPHRSRESFDDPDEASADRGKVRVWLELKSRKGFASTKQRTTMEVDPSALGLASLAGGIVPPDVLLFTMAGFGFFPSQPLRPIVAISYARYRFMEARTGFRVSLDSRVRSSMVAPGVGMGERGLELPGAVVEVKGPRFLLPEALLQLTEIGSSWTRFSKYSSSLDAHAEPRGTVARLWPSGLMEDCPGSLSSVRKKTSAWRPTAPALALETE